MFRIFYTQIDLVRNKVLGRGKSVDTYETLDEANAVLSDFRVYTNKFRQVPTVKKDDALIVT